MNTVISNPSKDRDKYNAAMGILSNKFGSIFNNH